MALILLETKMFKQTYILDVTQTEGFIRDALDQYAVHRDTYNGCYYPLYRCDVEQYMEEAEDPDIREGWRHLLLIMPEEFCLFYWW